jgi:hypothetical protein
MAREGPLPIDELKALPNPEIGERQHIRVTEIENQEHLDGPGPDPADLGQESDDVLRAHGPKPGLIGQPAGPGEPGQVEGGLGLGPRETGGPEPLGSSREQFGR